MQVLQIDFKEPDRKSETIQLFQKIFDFAQSSNLSATEVPGPSSSSAKAKPIFEEKAPGGHTSSLDEVELALESESRTEEVVHQSDCPLLLQKFCENQDKKTKSETNIRTAKAGKTSYHACLASR
jgi:hypothetical protein